MDKRFTIQEVNDLLANLEAIFEHIDFCRHKAETLAARSHPSPANPVQLEVNFLFDAVQDDIDHIAHLGGVVKDVEEGLVDFPGELDGQEIWLCWKRGENRVRFWHSLDTGFTERQALPDTDFHPTIH